VAKDACCVNAMRSGAMLRGRGIGQVYWPATACCSAHGDQGCSVTPTRRSRPCWPGSREKGRAAAGLSHPNIVAGLRQRLRGGHAPSGHEGVEAQSAATAPASRCRSGTIRPAARPASWSSSSSRTPTSKSGGRSTASARSWSAAASSAADVLTGRAAPARVGAAVLRNPVTRAVRWLTRFHGWTARTQHPFGVASVADAPGGGGGGQVVGPAHRRAPGPSRAAAMAA
jgi:hypothetical protein